MKKYAIALVSGLFCFSFICCSDETSVSPKPTPQEKGSLEGSFESKFARYEKGEAFAGDLVKLWRDTVWRNDRIHKQIILWSTKNDHTDLSYEVSDLKNEKFSISSENIQLRFGSYVKGDLQALDCEKQASRSAVLLTDALSPAHVTYLSVSDPLKIWVTVNVPVNALPGTYKGNITVKSSGVEQGVFDVELLVLDHQLSSSKDWSFHLDLWQFPYQMTKLIKQEGGRVEPFSIQYFQLMQPFYTMLADAGQSAITTYIKDGAFEKGQSMVKWIKKADGNWEFNYSDFDKYVEKMMQWGITKQINCFSLVGWDVSIGYYDETTSRQSNLKVEVGDQEYTIIWDKFLSSFNAHLTDKGWFDKTVLYMDEIEEDDMKKVIDIIKNNNPNWKIGLSGQNMSATTEARLYDYSSILNSNPRNQRTPRSTFYTSCAQTIPNNYVSKQNNTAEMTWMAWFAAANDFDGYLRWAYDYWTESDPMNIQDGTNTAGDFSMIYRSDNTLSAYPISSMRLELLREGIQDYEKIKILSNSQVNTYLSRFNENSGIDSRKLIEKGQSLLKSIASQK